MNSVYEALINIKSVRVYEDVEVSLEIKEAILDAAFMAPTAGNQMLYSIIDVTDQRLKERLAVSCDNQSFIAKAPLVFVYLADCRRWLDAYVEAGLNPRKPGAGDILLAFQDAVIAAQNSVIAAESFGLGSCYIGDILENKEEVVELLGLDEYVVPISMLVMGYPTEQQKNRVKSKRFNRKFIVHENSYRRLSGEEQREMFKEREDQEDFDFDDYIKKFCNRKYMSDFSLEMTRSSDLYLKNFIK
jgi:nitroreductase